MGDGVLIDVKSGGAPSPRPCPKGPDRLSRRWISRQQLYTKSTSCQPAKVPYLGISVHMVGLRLLFH